MIGGGAAALSAAITAREQGASVLLLECCAEALPRREQPPHAQHAPGARDSIRPLHGPLPGKGDVGKLHEGDGWRRATSNWPGWPSAVRPPSSTGCEAHGVKFQPALAGTLHLGRTNAWFLGGGKAMVNSLFRSAERLGVNVRYEAEVVGLDVRDGHFHSASVIMGGKTVTIPAKAVVVAAGGFQSNLAWLRQAWGPAADNFLIRGAPFDTGTLLKILLDHGAESVGEPTQAHMVPIDARSPKFDGGIVTRLDCVTLGIVVNKNGERYYDEGEDFWPMRYAIWGRLVAQQPDQISYVFIDSKTLDRFMPSVFPPVKGNTIAEVAEQFNLPVDKVNATVEEYNRAVQPGTFDHTIQDDCKTAGLTPPKTHWALRIDEPPFYGYPLRPGLTFTYFSVKIDQAGGGDHEGREAGRPTFLQPGKSCRETSCPRATSGGSAWSSAMFSGESPAAKRRLLRAPCGKRLRRHDHHAKRTVGTRRTTDADL